MGSDWQGACSRGVLSSSSTWEVRHYFKSLPSGARLLFPPIWALSMTGYTGQAEEAAHFPSWPVTLGTCVSPCGWTTTGLSLGSTA